MSLMFIVVMSVFLVAIPVAFVASRPRAPREVKPWTPDAYHRGVMRREAEIMLQCTYDKVGRRLSRDEALAWYRANNPSALKWLDGEASTTGSTGESEGALAYVAGASAKAFADDGDGGQS